MCLTIIESILRLLRGSFPLSRVNMSSDIFATMDKTDSETIDILKFVLL